MGGLIVGNACAARAVGCTVVPALIFDYDGLMVDSETVAAGVVLGQLAERGITTDLASIGHLFGSTGPDNERAWQELLGTWLGAALDMATFEAEFVDRVVPLIATIPLLPGVAELLAAARATGWRIALASGKQRAHLEANLRRLGVKDQFDVVVTSAEVDRGKPAPDVFLEVARRLRMRPDECVVLEDSLPGCQAGLAAGMTVVVCPNEATRDCAFPASAKRVDSLFEIDLVAFRAG